MSVNFAAVHDHKPWRKHRIHRTLEAAIDGNDGAINLLRRIGRVASMWQKYGDVRCVFVWGDDARNGQAFRLAPVGSSAVESAVVTIDRILEFDAKKECSAQEIAACFRSRGLLDPEPPSRLVGDPQQVDTDEPRWYPDDLPEGHQYFEGLVQEVRVNRYERSPEARQACIAHYRPVCQVCSIDFAAHYGSIGAGFIHVHHRVSISSMGSQYCIDPIKDLVPVCPNCHAMLHRREPPLEVEELRKLLNDR